MFHHTKNPDKICKKNNFGQYENAVVLAPRESETHQGDTPLLTLYSGLPSCEQSPIGEFKAVQRPIQRYPPSNGSAALLFWRDFWPFWTRFEPKLANKKAQSSNKQTQINISETSIQKAAKSSKMSGYLN